MWIHPHILSFWLSLLLVLRFCSCNDQIIEVVGAAECLDCTQNNIKGLSGLRIAIDCKVPGGSYKTKGVGEIDKKGQFKVVLSNEIVNEDKELKEECVAQLHIASSGPCPANNGLKASKIIVKSRDKGKLTFSPIETLFFSPAACGSAIAWPYRLPRFPAYANTYPWFRWPYPMIYFPPYPSSPPQTLYNPPPVNEEPLPPPPAPLNKPPPPPVPASRRAPSPPRTNHRVRTPVSPPPPPPPPIVNPPFYPWPLPPALPVYQMPLPPPAPIQNSPPPAFTEPYSPPFPFYMPRPPTYMRPLPPFPPFPRIPQMPRFPPNYFYRPRPGYWPVPPYSSYP